MVHSAITIFFVTLSIYQIIRALKDYEEKEKLKDDLDKIVCERNLYLVRCKICDAEKWQIEPDLRYLKGQEARLMEQLREYDY